MLSSRPRSGSFEAGLRADGANASSSYRESKPSPRFQRSRSTAGSSKASPSPEKRRGVTGGGGAMPMQQRVAQLEGELRRGQDEKARVAQLEEDLQREREEKARVAQLEEDLRREREEKARVAQLEEDLQREREEKARVAQLEEDLRREREEKARAVQELDELRRRDDERKDAEKVQRLEREVEKAKESERKMLESMIYQTKQLEQTKISLEEAKLEMATLKQQSNRSLASASGTWRGVMEQRSVKDFMFGGADDEVRVLRGELQTVMQAEEKSRKALEDLTVALSDVTMEAKQVKRWLADTQAELEAANAEAGRLRGELAATETRLREQHRCRLEAEESTAAWGDKERVFLECVRAAEEEVNLARQENTKLVESQRVIRDENARLRDILKQAVGEANVVKESLELARVENARLNDVVDEKEGALQSLRQEYECIKVSEAAAQGSLRELNSLLAATTTACSTPVSTKTAPVAPAPEYDERLSNVRLVASAKGTPETGSRRWMAEKPRTPCSRSYSIGEPAKFKGVGYSQSMRMGNVNPKDRMFASLSNIADLKSATDAAMDDYDDEFDHIDESQYVGTEHSVNDKKKRPILRKFGDLFRRKSFYKANSTPVHI